MTFSSPVAIAGSSRFADILSAALGRKVMTNLAETSLKKSLKKQRHHFVNKGPSSQGYGFSSGHVWM